MEVEGRRLLRKSTFATLDFVEIIKRQFHLCRVVGTYRLYRSFLVAPRHVRCVREAHSTCH